MNELAPQIEAFLLEKRTWVSARDICLRFNLPVDGRALRAIGDRPSVCADFAISHTKHGFKHISFATPAEAHHAYQARRSHGLGELVSARRMLSRWKSSIARKPVTPPMTRDGQFQLPSLLPHATETTTPQPSSV